MSHHDASHHHSHDCGHDHAHPPYNKSCHHGPLDRHASNDAICLQKVSFSYGANEALRDVTLHVERGCNLGIIGPNGGGKTTLLKIILGLLEGYSGTATVAGYSPSEVCGKGDVVGYVPQKHEFEPRFPVSVRQVVRMGLCGKTGWFKGHGRGDLQHVEWLIERVGMSDLAERAIGDLSGGQQQRAFIARALAAGPRILLMDEPTVGVDVKGQKQFADLVRGLQEKLELTVVIVSHDLRAIAATCEKVACVNRTLHYHDSPDGLTPELLNEIFQHDIAAIYD